MTTGKENLLKRIEIVKRLVDESYEPGNQQKCKLQVYRRNVMPVCPISERTFWRYLNADVNKKNKGKTVDPRLLKFDF